jgi:hopene-associated glycosyltransferase HpnB
MRHVWLIVPAVALAAWIWLWLARGRYWATGIRLPAAPAPEVWPSVAIVVPARDEAAMLPLTIPTLIEQRYPGPMRVILCDDGSTDGTGTLVASRWPSVDVIDPGPLPPGWAGKLWALRSGIEAAGDVDFLLLTDADIEHGPETLAAMVSVAEAAGLALVSQMARLRVQTGWERLVVPAFVYFFALLFPFRWSNTPGARTAAAAGGCSLIRRSALEAAGGVAAIRHAIIDDVALARAIKISGGTTFLCLADDVASVRPYPDLAMLWRMVSRSAYAQLKHSIPRLIGAVFGLALIFWVPPVATVIGVATGDPWTAGLGAAAWLLLAGLYAPMLRYYRVSPLLAFALPVTTTLYLGMTVDSAIRHHRGAGGAWKGRTY